MANAEYPFSSFNFLVQLFITDASGQGLATPLCESEFAECDGLEMTMEPKTVREGGNNTQHIHLIGPVSYGNLILKRGMTSNQDLWKWFSLSTGEQRRSTRATGVILMRDAQGAAKVRFKLSDCLPLKVKAPALNAKDGILAIEEMQLTYDSLTIEPA